MPACLLAGGQVLALAAGMFTLSWTHSVEKIEWRESWRVTPAGLQIVEARVKGSGAGMEPPPDARLEDGWWVYAPRLKPVAELRLAASGATGAGWRLCGKDECRQIGIRAQEPVIVKPCP